MTIVVDLGCADWGKETSVDKLIERFEPELLYGFDPALRRPRAYTQGKTKVVLRAEAAWIYNGFIGFELNGTRSAIGEGIGEEVACIDLGRFLTSEIPYWKPNGSVHEIIVKMDIEGAEYKLLDYLISNGYDEMVDRFLVEWHETAFVGGRTYLEEKLGDKVETWE